MSHRDVAEEYGKLKLELKQKFEYNRDGYTYAKTEFVNKTTKLAREEMGNKYSGMNIHGGGKWRLNMNQLFLGGEHLKNT